MPGRDSAITPANGHAWLIDTIPETWNVQQTENAPLTAESSKETVPPMVCVMFARPSLPIQSIYPLCIRDFIHVALNAAR